MFTPGEYEQYFVNVIGVAYSLGHGSPATLQPYIDQRVRDSTPLLALVLDAFEATLPGHPGVACRAKLERFVVESDLLDAIAEAMV